MRMSKIIFKKRATYSTLLSLRQNKQVMTDTTPKRSIVQAAARYGMYIGMLLILIQTIQYLAGLYVSFFFSIDVRVLRSTATAPIIIEGCETALTVFSTSLLLGNR